MATETTKPVVISVPEPRSLDLIFTPAQKANLFDRYQIIETTEAHFDQLSPQVLASARYILGQPPLSLKTLQAMPLLKCVFNVESNLIDNMPYDYLFEKGIYVLTTGAVFALPVAELGVAMALNLARDVVHADEQFKHGSEVWGFESNANARLLTGSNIGIIGFGELGKALAKVLSGFNAQINVYDPWLPDSLLEESGVKPSRLENLLQNSDTLFVVAAVTSENQKFLGANELKKMKTGAALVLLSRAEVVDFDALMDAVSAGAIVAASDVFPEEPLSLNHRVRGLKGFVRSAHRAGALDSAFKKMGDMVLEDMQLLDQNLPPMRCKRAERETVSRMRSKPVSIN